MWNPLVAYKYNATVIIDKYNSKVINVKYNLIDEKNSAIVSRIIKQTVDAGLIRLYDPTANRKHWRYVPCWA
jgi:hypothetical protein